MVLEKIKSFSEDYTKGDIKYNLAFHIFFIIFGLLCFSYFVQSPNCFLFNDIRRNIIGLISGFLIISTFIYSIPYYIKSSNQDIASTDDIKYEILKSIAMIVLQVFIIFVIFAPIVILTSADLKLSNPEWFSILKTLAIGSSCVLILGGVIPFSESIFKRIINTPVTSISDW